jgi:hypothetical protein
MTDTVRAISLDAPGPPNALAIPFNRTCRGPPIDAASGWSVGGALVHRDAPQRQPPSTPGGILNRRLPDYTRYPDTTSLAAAPEIGQPLRRGRGTGEREACASLGLRRH